MEEKASLPPEWDVASSKALSAGVGFLFCLSLTGAIGGRTIFADGVAERMIFVVPSRFLATDKGTYIRVNGVKSTRDTVAYTDLTCYRTGSVARCVSFEPCQTGRTLALLSPLPLCAATPGGGSDVAGGYGDLPGLGPDDHVGLAVDDGGSSSYHSSSDDEDLEEEATLSMEDRVKLTKIWVANPTISHHWTSGAGGGVV
ncbi:hypothetical protein ZWY2020_032393 [Hordeum vulgare]|nr:hypothetical protein ZWY2020_032393 [Hordeum vulgare]